MEIVRAGDQRLVTVHLHGRRGGQLMATAGGSLQSPVVRGSLVDDVTARRGRVSVAVDRQRRAHVVVQRAVLMSVQIAVRTVGRG